MPKGNNDKSWPYQTFHDANKHKSDRTDDPTWFTRYYEYSNSGQVWKMDYKSGKGVTSNPSSVLCEASSIGTGKQYSVTIKK